MAEETAQPEASNETVAAPAGDTVGTAVEQPQQQTEGADVADETPVVELSAEQTEGWNKLPADQRKILNKLFTQKTQGIAEERKALEQYKRLHEALEADPDTTVELLARHRGFTVTRQQQVQPTPQEQQAKDETFLQLQEQFGPEAAALLFKAVEKRATDIAEAKVKPYQEFHQQTVDQARKAEVIDALQELGKEFPDYGQYVPQMNQLAQQLKPGPGITPKQFARMCYLAVAPGKTSAQQTKAVIEKINKAASAAEAPAQPVSSNRVAKSRPQGLSFEKSILAAAEAAGRGETWD